MKRCFRRSFTVSDRPRTYVNTSARYLNGMGFIPGIPTVTSAATTTVSASIAASRVLLGTEFQKESPLPYDKNREHPD